jgi:hypothetical protein
VRSCCLKHEALRTRPAKQTGPHELGNRAVLRMRFPRVKATDTPPRSGVSSSRPNLRKTGIFTCEARDFQFIHAKIATIREAGDARNQPKNGYIPAFSPKAHTLSQVERLSGWRRSADRTVLQTNSLQTGNFSRNWKLFGSSGRNSNSKTRLPRAHFSRFPARFNRENNFIEQGIWQLKQRPGNAQFPLTGYPNQ